MADTKLLRVVKLEGVTNNRLYIERNGEETRVRLIGGDEALARLGSLIEATGKPWRDFISLGDHEEYGEYAFVDGAVETPLYD
jgi:hypothetical protein